MERRARPGEREAVRRTSGRAPAGAAPLRAVRDTAPPDADPPDADGQGAGPQSADAPDADTPEAHLREAPGARQEGPSRLWHVTLSASGPRTPLPRVRGAMERFSQAHPFLPAVRYAADRAEIRYWEEARDLHDAAAVALRLWGEHRSSAGLPPWEIVGLEVIDRRTYRQRVAEGCGPAPAVAAGVHPF
ncbi:hypothetical protein GQS52_18595 [Streptomyces sp. SCUT-3]|nr:hypothetical protein GQS52_18595 [Streptomyces sp. SCUT-3]